LIAAAQRILAVLGRTRSSREIRVAHLHCNGRVVKLRDYPSGDSSTALGIITWLKGKVRWDIAVQFFFNLAATFYLFVEVVEG
jgi:hypothetical protein